MEIRRAEYKDIAKVRELAGKHDLVVPEDGTLVVAEDTNGEIKAFVNLRMVMTITPFVSENPIIGKKLYDYCEKMLIANNYPLLQCLIEKTNKGLLEKLGFSEIFIDHITMEKLLLQ